MKSPRGISGILVIIIVLAVAIGIVLGIVYAPKKTSQNTNANQNQNTNQIIGGDTDEHGCLIAAGYSWCETKSKCLRTWEEECAISTNSNNNSSINTTAIDTKDWKTYENTTYGYSIKYPPSWIISEYPLGEGNIYVSPPNAAAERTLEIGPDMLIQSVDKIYEDNELVIDKQMVEIGSLSVVRQTENGMSSYPTIYFPYQDKYVQVSWDNLFEQEYPEYEVILSTFQFTDATAGWKTYTNSTYGYSFKYPNEYTVTEGDHVSLDKTNASMDLSILDRQLDPNNILGIYGKHTTTTVAVGDQNGYQYLEGDAGCGGDFIQTVLKDNKTLRIYFGVCEGETNELYTDLNQRNQILSTFQFTD